MRVPLILDAKKIAAAMRCNLPISHIVRLILCFFDFRYLPCCCGYNPYAFIAHTVQQRVKLPPPGGFLRIAVREEKIDLPKYDTGLQGHRIPVNSAVVPCSRYSQGSAGKYITRRLPFCGSRRIHFSRLL